LGELLSVVFEIAEDMMAWMLRRPRFLKQTQLKFRADVCCTGAAATPFPDIYTQQTVTRGANKRAAYCHATSQRQQNSEPLDAPAAAWDGSRAAAAAITTGRAQ
jgi:hypothetical protein